MCVLFVLCVFLCFAHRQQVSSESKLMKRSFSTIGDQCVNGDWQEEFSLERVSPDRLERPRQRSFRGQFAVGLSKAGVLRYHVDTKIEKLKDTSLATCEDAQVKVTFICVFLCLHMS